MTLQILGLTREGAVAFTIDDGPESVLDESDLDTLTRAIYDQADPLWPPVACARHNDREAYTYAFGEPVCKGCAYDPGYEPEGS